MKAILVDLDGTLFDTKDVNFRAYQEACQEYGYTIEYDYYCKFCNGRHYLEFLPQITTEDENILSAMHKKKKDAYKKFLGYARINTALVDLLQVCRKNCKTALVTTASKENTYQILDEFGITELFDIILTREDVEKGKPDPEGYLKAMRYFQADPKECIIFEDSNVGIEAAEKSGAAVFVVKGYN